MSHSLRKPNNVFCRTAFLCKRTVQWSGNPSPTGAQSTIKRWRTKTLLFLRDGPCSGKDGAFPQAANCSCPGCSMCWLKTVESRAGHTPRWACLSSFPNTPKRAVKFKRSEAVTSCRQPVCVSGIRLLWWKSWDAHAQDLGEKGQRLIHKVIKWRPLVTSNHCCSTFSCCQLMLGVVSVSVFIVLTWLNVIHTLTLDTVKTIVENKHDQVWRYISISQPFKPCSYTQKCNTRCFNIQTLVSNDNNDNNKWQISGNTKKEQ